MTNLATLAERWEERDMGYGTPCWVWTRRLNRDGYGMTRRPRGARTSAHLVIYELSVGTVPDGMELDHLCRVRACVNPAHLEPKFTQENTYMRDGKRSCRRCTARLQREYQARRRASIASRPPAPRSRP